MGVKLVSSSGGSVELVAPTTASNYTMTVPANSGTVITTASTFAGTGPAFSAYANSAQSVASSTFTALIADTEDFDTASCFNNTGSAVGGIPAYSFLPNVAGYYQVTGQMVFVSSTSGEVFCSIYKNGSRFLDGTFTYYSTAVSDVVSTTATGVVYLNGSSDYITFYGNQSSGSAKNTFIGSRASRFQAALVRAA